MATAKSAEMPPGLPTAAEILEAVRQAALIATKPTLRFPGEAMLYLGLGETAARRFCEAHGIRIREYFPGGGASSAAFVRRADLDRAQNLCRVKGRPKRRPKRGQGQSRGGRPRQPHPPLLDSGCPAPTDPPTETEEG